MTSHEVATRPGRPRRVPAAHVPGAVGLISQPGRPGLVWAGGWPDRGTCLADLTRRALTEPWAPSQASLQAEATAGDRQPSW